MTYDSLVNREDHFSVHYLAEVLPKDLKTGLLNTWKQREDEARARAEAEARRATERGIQREPATLLPSLFGRASRT